MGGRGAGSGARRGGGADNSGKFRFVIALEKGLYSSDVHLDIAARFHLEALDRVRERAHALDLDHPNPLPTLRRRGAKRGLPPGRTLQ